MQVALLAAGLGSRLGELTAQLPKALISVAGEPLIVRAIAFGQATGASEVIVVGGFGYGQLAAEIERRALPVTLVENLRYRDGNLLSLMAARPRLREGFLIMNVDHIYRPTIAALVAAGADRVTAFVDYDRVLAGDDMKVKLDEQGRVAGIAKTLADFDCGYVGMTLVPASSAASYWAAADAVLATDGPAVHVERVLAWLAAHGDPPACRDISGHGWLEVDVAEEREHAEAVLRRGAWR